MGKLVLAFIMVIGSALVLFSAPFVFSKPFSVPGYEFVYAQGLAGAAVLFFVGIRTIIFEARWKKSLERQ